MTFDGLIRVDALLAWIALLMVAGCGGAKRDSPSDASPPEPTLFLAGNGEQTVVDVNSGRAEVNPLAELAPGDPPYRIARRRNELIVYGGDAYILDPDLSSPPRKLGDSWFFIPSAKPDRVWLTLLDPSSPDTVRALAAVREVSVDGGVTFPDVRPPGGRGPLAAVGDDLVFWDGRGGLELWNPATGRDALEKGEGLNDQGEAPPMGRGPAETSDKSLRRQTLSEVFG